MTLPNPPSNPRPRGVVDPIWEEELRAGQEGDTEAAAARGSVERELAALHLLRHVREPEELSPERYDALWTAIAQEALPTPWWRRRFWAFAVPLVTAAAVVAVLVVRPGGGAVSSGPDGLASGQSGSATGRRSFEPVASADGPQSQREAAAARPRSPQAEALELQFAALEPEFRGQLRRGVDQQRHATRGKLVADALVGTKPATSADVNANVEEEQ